MTRAGQIAFNFNHQPAYRPDDFMPMPCNATALNALDDIIRTGYGMLYVWGPKGAGKTHFTHLAAARLGVTPGLPADPTSRKALVVDDVDTLDTAAQEKLFHVYNHVRQARGTLVLASAPPPARIELLADLQSRLRTIPQAELAPLGQAQLQLLLVKLADDRQLQLDPAVIRFLLRHTERSAHALEAMVDALDQRGLEQGRKITIPLVRMLMDDVEA